MEKFGGGDYKVYGCAYCGMIIEVLSRIPPTSSLLTSPASITSTRPSQLGINACTYRGTPPSKTSPVNAGMHPHRQQHMSTPQTCSPQSLWLYNFLYTLSLLVTYSISGLRAPLEEEFEFPIRST
jgi:hypothetical protein